MQSLLQLFENRTSGPGSANARGEGRDGTQTYRVPRAGNRTKLKLPGCAVYLSSL